MKDVGQAAQSIRNPADGATGVALDRSPQGERHGDRVVLLRSPQSLAKDIQEEIGFVFQDRKGAESSRRRAGERRATNRALSQVERVHEAESYFDRVPDLRARRSEVERLGRVMRGMTFRTEDDLIQHLRKSLSSERQRPDATFLYGALGHIERQLENDPDATALAKMAGRASSRLLARHGVEIQKGAVVSEAAALYVSERLGSASDLRRLYMDEVVKHESTFKTFLNILDEYSEDSLPQAIGFLLRAAGEDLLSLPDDAGHVRQKAVIDSLYQLEVLNTVRGRSDLLVERVTGLIDGHGLSSPENFTSRSVLEKLFKLASNSALANETVVTGQTNAMLPSPIPVQVKINYLREFREAAAMLPIKVFEPAQGMSDKNARQTMLNAIIGAQTIADSEEAILRI